MMFISMLTITTHLLLFCQPIQLLGPGILRNLYFFLVMS